MPIIWADQALLPTGWARNVRIEIQRGRIQTVTTDATPEGYRTAIALPAPVNVHSHAFQRAMAGLTEARGPDPRDTFWTWRQMMYRFLDQLTPEDVEAIAALVQLEMLEAGYATAVEFHYLHHQPDGTPYQNLSEMSERILAAADTSGIAMTLLPVFYQYGGCDKRALADGQHRFGNDLDRFTELYTALKNAVPDNAILGVAPHSLRAIDPTQLSDLVALAEGRPIHMHLAEQDAEVTEVEAVWATRPAALLFDHADVGKEWCLIHCTLLSENEIEQLTTANAVAGLCPITEANLGDGIFDATGWFGQGGSIAIGSDSNVDITLAGELRQLEYSQRLRHRARAVLADTGTSTGRRMFDAICVGGGQASGRETGKLEPGKYADILALDADHVDAAGLLGDTVLDAFVFAGGPMVGDVWVAGQHLVRGGQHVNRDVILQEYRAAVARLRGAL
ncbi:MAG: formimidoylglutamate deiminase [Pseudomonadota bacterium]